jgi:L-glutamine:2-deoxy-scyllo-inosose/3-amino-2,3-dideoxy-scyllo-inosose aminotransferase
MMNAGEGGALITSDEELYGRVMSLRSCGRRSESGAKVHSGNYRMTSFQAAVLRAELSALKDNADELDRRGRALDQYIDQAPGVQSLYRHPNLTRQCSYGFAFLYDAQAYGDIPAAIFRSALSAELGVMFGSCYEPLNHSPYYFPHTKRRHHISDRYVDAITPDRFDLPVAEALWRDRIVQTHWPIFQLPPERAAVVGDAVAKIYEHRRELCESDE